MIRVESPKRAGIALALIFFAAIDGGVGLSIMAVLDELEPSATHPPDVADPATTGYS